LEGVVITLRILKSGNVDSFIIERLIKKVVESVQTGDEGLPFFPRIEKVIEMSLQVS
jgi:hypothetical protein